MTNKIKLTVLFLRIRCKTYCCPNRTCLIFLPSELIYLQEIAGKFFCFGEKQVKEGAGQEIPILALSLLLTTCKSICDVIKQNESEIGNNMNMLLISDYFYTLNIEEFETRHL